MLKTSLFTFLFVLLISFSAVSQSTVVDNIDFSFTGETVDIKFELRGTESQARFYVNIVPFFENGERINAKTISGDVGIVDAGKRQVSWAIKTDGITIENRKVYFEIKATQIPEVHTGRALAKSLVLPGWGNYELSPKKPNWIWSAASYGLLGTSAFFTMQSLNNYSKYKSAQTSESKDFYFQKTQKSKQPALIFAGVAGLSWSLNLASVVAKSKKLKNPSPDFIQNHNADFITFNGRSRTKNLNTKGVVQPPLLVLSPNSLHFEDQNFNNALDANETGNIKFTLQNLGKGDAQELTAIITETSGITDLYFDKETFLGTLSKGKSFDLKIPIRAAFALKAGQSNFTIKIKENNGFDADPIEISIPTIAFKAPKPVIADYLFQTEKGLQPKLSVPITLVTSVQNQGTGVATNVSVRFEIPKNVLNSGEKEFLIGTLKPGESKVLNFEFFANKQFELPSIPVFVEITESWGKFGVKDTVQVLLNKNLTKTKVNLTAKNTQEDQFQQASLSSETDKNIPTNQKKYPNRYALIIGNEDYTSKQADLNPDANVAFARNDAEIFKTYCTQVLGVLPENTTLLTDATAAEMRQEIDRLTKMVSIIGKDAELIFYYAGHGLPDEKTQSAYLIPVDVRAANIQEAIKISDLYTKFSECNAKRTLVFLDACFSGGGREAGLLAARNVRIKAKTDVISGNFVVFAASTGDQTALPYKDKQHGMFTYFLLKQLQESKGDISLGDLSDYLNKQVRLSSLQVNQKEQSPQVNCSPTVQEIWRNWKMNP